MLGDSWLSGHREVSLCTWTTRRREQWREEGARNQCSPSRPNARSRVISGSHLPPAFNDGKYFQPEENDSDGGENTQGSE